MVVTMLDYWLIVIDMSPTNKGDGDLAVNTIPISLQYAHLAGLSYPSVCQYLITSELCLNSIYYYICTHRRILTGQFNNTVT